LRIHERPPSGTHLHNVDEHGNLLRDEQNSKSLLGLLELLSGPVPRRHAGPRSSVGFQSLLKTCSSSEPTPVIRGFVKIHVPHLPTWDLNWRIQTSICRSLKSSSSLSLSTART
jgi:hypothetical protein